LQRSDGDPASDSKDFGAIERRSIEHPDALHDATAADFAIAFQYHCRRCPGSPGLCVIGTFVPSSSRLMTAGKSHWVVREEAVMGTAVRVELAHDDPRVGASAAEAVIQEMRRVDGAMSPYKPESELSRIDREAGRAAVPISPELFDLIRRSIDFSQWSGGAFDITFAAVGRFYDYRNRVRPSDAQVARALAAFDYHHLLLDAGRRTIRFAHPEVQIDLGGIAKGYAVDNCVRLLQSRGVRAAMVSAGGDSRVFGSRDGRPWIIGVRDPRRPDGMIARLPLIDAAISTSGDYERYFEEDGVRHHHILDPATGKSAVGVRAATIVGPDATTTEGVSKTVFVKGVHAGLKLVDSLPGVDAVVVDAGGRMFYSNGLRNGR
jgi:thiamine biosynthesis lipoprotein